MGTAKGEEEPIPAVSAGVSIGPDRLFRRGRQVVIDSPSDMPDWAVRKYRRTRVLYEGAGYFLSRRTLLKPGLWRYVLEPWPDEPADPPWQEIVYGPTWVAEREENERAVERRRQSLPLLWALWPFTGLLPSRVQAELSDRYGITQTAAVERSLVLEYGVILILSVILVIGNATHIFRTGPPLFAILCIGIDALIRRDALVREEANPPGFYEWLWQAAVEAARRIRRLF